MRDYKFTTHFYGNEISAYGRKYGRVDYATLSKAFDAVLNNEIMKATWGVCGEWEQESGFIDNSDEIEELEEQIEALEDLITVESTADQDDETTAKIEKLRARKEDLEYEQDEPAEIFQYYIVSDNGASILEEYNEIVFYNETLDMYVWGVTHFGTSWDYVLTDIPCEIDENANA